MYSVGTFVQHGIQRHVNGGMWVQLHVVAVMDRGMRLQTGERPSAVQGPGSRVQGPWPIIAGSGLSWGQGPTVTDSTFDAETHQTRSSVY